MRHLRYFLALADELHFGRAAEIVGIAQPALSQQIQKLEALLGTALVHRTSRHVTLTAAGRVLQERARTILVQTSKDLDEVTRVGHGEQGRLDVGFVSSALHLGPIERVQDFRRRYPAVDVVLHEGFTNQLLARVLRGEIDVATVRDPDELQGIRTEAVAVEPFVAVLPADHPRAGQPSTSGAELAGEAFVFYPAAAGQRAHGLNLQPVTESGRSPRVVQEASSWATIMYLIGAGLGVSIAPASATVGAPANVRVLPLTGTDAHTTLYLAMRANDRNPLLANYFDLAGQTAERPGRSLD